MNRERQCLVAAALFAATIILGGCPIGNHKVDSGNGRFQKGHDPYVEQREAMVEQQLVARGIDDAAVLSIMRKTPRHLFVPHDLRDRAYEDTPLPIGEDQTISQPYIVAYMTQCLKLKRSDSVLEVGTGSGYQAAVLSQLADSIHTIEIIESLAETARRRLKELGYANVSVRHGNGYLGWPEAAPFDAIIVTAAPHEIPEPLKLQLAVGGRLVIPVGDEQQSLVMLHKVAEDDIEEERLIPVRFVPMTGKPGKKRK